MLNLVYHETQDEKVYTVLSERLQDTYDIFGSLPDTIEDDWPEKMTYKIFKEWFDITCSDMTWNYGDGDIEHDY